MLTIFKKYLALCLALLLTLGMLSACGGGQTAEPTEPEVTEPAEEAKALKILTLGHSLTVDSGHMLNLVADLEGFEKELVVGTLYYSGCNLWQHEEFLTNDSRVYSLYLSSSATPNTPPTIMENVTMREALVFDYWDIIIMQGGVYEITQESTYTDGRIQLIQDYVNQHKVNPNAVFMWHNAWVPPIDPDLMAMYNHEPHVYEQWHEKFNNDRTAWYKAMMTCVENHILTDDTFVAYIPSGTAMMNASTSYLTEKDLHRDYAHASDLGRIIAAYTWYCTLAGIDRLEEIKMDAIPINFFRSTSDTVDHPLTQTEKDIILESVNNALAKPLEMTQSQYTVAPTE